MSQDVRLDDPAPEVLREYIRAMVCYWCGKGPWKSLANHTAMAHGITASELRDMAMLYKHDSFLSPDYKAEMSRQRKESDSGARLQGHPQRGPLNYTKAGLIAQEERKRRFVEMTKRPEAQEQRKRAARAGIAKKRKPHPCHWCGRMTERSYPKTCSPECRREIRRQTGRASFRKLDYDKLRRPHPCPNCGRVVPAAKPKYCSDACIAEARRRRKTYWPCTVCAKDTGSHRKRTCSPECLQEARRRQGKAYSSYLHRPQR